MIAVSIVLVLHGAQRKLPVFKISTILFSRIRCSFGVVCYILLGHILMVWVLNRVLQGCGLCLLQLVCQLHVPAIEPFEVWVRHMMVNWRRYRRLDMDLSLFIDWSGTCILHDFPRSSEIWFPVSLKAYKTFGVSRVGFCHLQYLSSFIDVCISDC